MDHPVQLNTPPATPPSLSTRARRLRPLGTALLLGLIVLLGGYFRTLNLRDWDNGTEHHPDERYMHYTVVNLRVPDDWRTYFISSCPTPVPAPRNPSSEPKDWEPSEQSGCSTLNPRNFVSWSSGYVYGTLPTTLTRLVVELTKRTDTFQVLLIGRWLSTLADLITLLALFFLARTLYGRRTALLAAALYAGAVMPIQQSHFFTVDNFAVCFGTLALLFTTQLGRSTGGWRRWLQAILSGLFIAAAVASKINMAALVALVFVAIAQIAWRDWHASAASDAPPATRTVLRRMTRYVVLLGLTGLVTFVAFRVFQPDAFAGPNIWNIWPEERFVKLLKQARETADGTIDLPSSLQWAARKPWLFPWQNMVLWGMGLPLGLTAWLAWAAAGWRLIVRRRGRHLVPWLWIALYFGWQGQQFVTTMRYFLPLYAPLIMFAAWALVRLFDRLRAARPLGRWPALDRALVRLRRPSLAAGLLVLVLAATWSWAFAYTRIYTRAYTRVAAADWLKRVAPNGATTTWEWWDDLLPLPGGDQYRQLVTYPYGEEEREKYIGKAGGVVDANGDPDGLIATLAQADYVVLNSPRVYGAVERVPQRYPATLRYYQALFDGSLGFELVAEFHSSPSLFGIPISDIGAEEAFWVYDHPPVLVFRRTPTFSPAQARYLLTENIAWDDIYRGLRPVQINEAPTALQLTARAWSRLQASSAGYLFNGPASPLLALLLWLLAIEALGLATAGLLWRLRLPLADRGLSLSRMLGLLLFAAPPAVLGATQLLPIGRTLLALWYASLLLGGGWLLWRERRPLAAFVMAQRTVLGAAQLLYLALLVLGLLLVRGRAAPADDLVARWTALVRAPTLPPYDPLFVGGFQPQGYAAQLPFALLDRLLGLLPSTALRLALPTALALLVLAAWSAIYNYLTPARWQRSVRPDQLTAPVLAAEAAPVDVEPADVEPVLAVEAAPVDVGPVIKPNPQPEPVPFVSAPPAPASESLSRLRNASLRYAGLLALLLLLPGLPLGTNVSLSLWTALLSGRLDLLGLAALLATALALGTTLRQSALLPRRPALLLGALLALPLIFLRGQGLWPLLATALPLAAIALAGTRGDLRRWAALLVPPLALALLLGTLFSWSIALPVAQAAPDPLHPGALLLGWLVPLVLLTLYSLLVAPQMVERGLGVVVASVVLGWTGLAIVVLRWSVSLVLVPPLMALIWLALQAWLPGWGPRRWRAGVLLATAAVALLLVLVAGLQLLGRLAGAGEQLFALATVLLVIAAVWTLPSLSWAARRVLRRAGGVRWLGSALMVGVALWLIVVSGLTSRAAVAAQTPPTTLPPALSGASAWLNQNATGAPVLALAAQPESAAVVGATGLPTLLTDANTQRRLRNLLDPSINGVVDGRQRVLSELYGGDANRARELLLAYQIGYVLVGPYEQAQYGEQAGAALDALVQRNALSLTYDRDGVRIYAANAAAQSVPPYVTQSITLTPPRLSTLMLDRPVAELPVVNEYGWNALATRAQPLGVGLWLLLLEVLGLLAWPLTSAVFGCWHDRGWGLSKLAGLVVWGYAVWLPVNLRWWSFNWWALVFGALVVALLSAPAVYRWRRPADPSTSAGRAAGLRAAILRSELCFLLAFGLWTLVRAANPDLWDPFFGGEKPFEFGFLNALVRTPVLPPYDPFFSGGIVNYYYYGLYLMALPIRATGIDPAIGFNLALATLLALAATAALALGRELTGRWRYGLLALLLLVGVGPLASVVHVNEARGLAPVRDALSGGLSGFSERLGFWFWGPSRVIPFTINEFPLFSYLFGDLHPHMIALPITLLAMACALELLRRGRLRLATLALSALVIGALAVANSWDAPTYALLIGGALIGRAWRGHQARLSWASLGRVALAALIALGTVAGGLLLYLPFFMHYRAQVGGIGRVHATDSPLQYALIYGPLLFLGISLLGSLAWLALAQTEARRRTLLRAGTIALPLLIVALMLTSATTAAPDPSQHVGWSLRLMLGLLGLSGIGLALLPLSTRRLRDREWLALWLITVGMLVGLGIQFVLVRDHLADSPSERMNTVFKFGMQIWALWAIGGAAALPVILRALRRSEVATGVWLGLLVVLLLPGLAYPLIGIPSRLGTRFDRTQPLTLDGLAFMPRATYNYEDQPISLRFDGEAIGWLKQNITGTPVLLTSDREFYRTYGMRIAANTGLPTVLGRLHQDEQRPPAEVSARADDVQTLYDTPDVATATELLAKYGVQYVYIGPIERATYRPEGVAKFAQMQGALLELAYQNEAVQIYRVLPQVGSAVPSQAPPPSTPAADPTAEALAQQLAINPDDSGAAFGLARRYIDLNRPAEAAQVLSAAADRHPEDVPMLHLLGDVQAQIGNADAAIDAWQRAVAAQPTAMNINKLGQGQLQLGRLEDAEATFNRALNTDPAFPDPHFFLGELYRTRNGDGDRERAVAAYRRYLETAPADGPWRASAEAQLSALQ